MATHDYVIANGTGQAVRSDLNDALAAIVSNNSGSSEPATTYAYQWWADTTANVLKIRNSANNAWITLRELDGTMLIEDGSASSPGLSFASDTNSGLFGGSDTIGFATGGAERLEIGSSEVVFNDPSNDVDFRVESNGNTHMLFVDAGNDRVGIGTSSPSRPLSVSSSQISARFTSTSADSQIEVVDTSGTVVFGSSSGNAIVQTGGSEVARIDSSGRLLLGTTTEGRAGATDNLTIADSADCGITIRSGASNDGAIDFSDSTSGSGEFAGQILYDHGSNFMRFMTASSERARVDSNGRLLVGLTSSSASAASVLQGFAGSSTGQGILQLQVGKNNAATANNENLGSLRFANSDGSIGALISSEADGQWASSDYPGRLTFFTTADGASSATERLRINSSGNVGLGETSPDTRLHIKESTTGATGIFIQNSNGATNSSADLYFGNWSGSSTGTPQARLSAINTNVSTAKTDLAISIYDGNNTLERARIDGDGRLLLGTSTSTYNIGNQAKLGVVITGDLSRGGIDITGYTGGSSTGRSPELNLNRSIGTTDGSVTALTAAPWQLGKINFSGSTGSNFSLGAQIYGVSAGTAFSGSNSGGEIRFATTAVNATSPTERMRIGSYGRSHNFSADGATQIFANANGSGTSDFLIIGRHSSTTVDNGTNAFFVYTNGNVQNSNTSYGGISDVKLKENIVDANSQWDDIKRIQVRNYNFKEETGYDTHTQLGVVAQELETVSPGLVYETPDLDEEGNDLGTVTKSVSYSVLYMKAVKALQEAMDRIETLETKVAALEAG
jgi:hypothetical protein